MATRVRRHYGKYRGTVTNNVDPLLQGRVMVRVPEVLGAAGSAWAMPCVPLAGPRASLYVLPQVGDAVWVEFEAGFADRPVWVGGFWAGAGEIPPLAKAAWPQSPPLLLQAGNTVLRVSDQPGPAGGLLLKAGDAVVSIGDDGITISNGKGATLTLRGPVVDCNGGALTVA